MGGDRRKGGRSRAPLSRPEQVSKKLSWVLRHGAEKEGLKLGPGGYVNAGDVLKCNALRSFKVSLDELKGIVAENEKKRFSLIPDPSKSRLKLPATEAAEAAEPAEQDNDEDERLATALDGRLVLNEDIEHDDPSNYLIRANQGHSLPVEMDELLVPITAENMPDTVVHGTTKPAWQRILASGGLSKMGRNHIHFAAGLPRGFHGSGKDDAENKVTSGMRLTSEILVYVDISKSMEDGIKFWLSENGVILTAGNEKGFLETKYFKKVEQVSRQKGPEANKTLMVDGTLTQ